MRLLLLPLAGLLLGGEAFETFEHIPMVDRVFFIKPTPQYIERVKAVQRKMLINMAGHGMPPLGLGDQRPTVFLVHHTRISPGRGPTIAQVPPQGDIIESDHSGLGQTKRPSEGDQKFSPPNSGHNQSPSTVNQDHNPSGLDQVPKTSPVNDKPSNSFNQQPEPSAFDQQHKDSGFPQASGTPSFNPTPNPSTSQDFKPPSFEEDTQPIKSDENHRHSSFGQGEKSFDNDKKIPFSDTLDSHPDRNPVCYSRPDPGTCRAALPRYYLDPETGTCNCFLYGGCREDGKGESPGTYFTLQECQQECHPPNMEEGPICKDIFKEEQFISYLVDPPPKKTSTDHLSDEDYLSSILK